MTALIDLAFLLLAAAGGAAAAWLVGWCRAWPVVEIELDEESRFARETLARLQEVTRRVATEVDQHSSCVEEINAQLSASDDADEAAVLAAVAKLLDANQRIKRQLDTAEQRLKAQEQQIESHAAEARTDALTQVANRRALDDELQRCLAEFERRGEPATVMLLDVDHFKKFNDTHGHQAGDEILRGVARVLRQAVSDVGLVARYGGEEFAIVFSGMESAAALPISERARQAISTTPFRIEGRELRLTVSAGVADLLSGDTDREVVGRADEALYASKNAGRNCGHYNDGHTNQLIRLDEPLPSIPVAAPAAADKVGDEWLFDSDDPTENLFREPIPHIAHRPAFFDDLIRRLAHWQRGGTPLTVMLVQVDAFNRILSDHGPAASEVVLRVTAQLINAVMRDMDHVARLSEDTFAVILPGALLHDGVSIGERLRNAVQRCHLPRKAGANWYTISVGVVEASEGDDLRRILQRARIALAAAVNQGRNCVVGRDANGAQVREGALISRS
jgi:diguanylate cyclase